MNFHFPPSLPIPQRDTRELLDQARFGKEETARSLSDVARINGFFGATNALYETVWRSLESAHLPRATVLDLGCGGGDFTRQLVRRSRARKLELHVIGVDILPLHLEIAREQTPPDFPIEWLEADAFALPFADGSVDFVTSSLFLHHFRPDAIRKLLAECSRVARVGWAMNDCARDGMALAAFRVLRPYLARSFLTRFDALASIRRSYTPDEMRAVVENISGARVRELFPYRLQVEWKGKDF